MKSSFSIKQIKEIGQAVKKGSYQKSSGRWTLGYGKWVPRLISPYITWAVLRISPSIQPNMISYMMLFICVGAQILLLKGFYVAGGIVLYFSVVMDKVDGEVARMKSIYSHRGIFLDYQYHFVYWLSFLFIGLSIYMREGSVYPLLLGIISSLLGIHLRYTRTCSQKIMFKMNKAIGHITAIHFSYLKPHPFAKLINLLHIISRQDMVAIALVLFGILGFRYPAAPTIFLQFYLLVLVIYALNSFTNSFRTQDLEMLGTEDD